MKKYGGHNRSSVCTDGKFVEINEIIICFPLTLKLAKLHLQNMTVLR